MPPNGVNIMTAHGSKGLEFDYVFVVNVNDGIWSGKTSRTSFNLPTGFAHDTLEDERRLFYVALTRARRHVFVTYSEKGNDGKDLSPSEFIYEINPQYMETISPEKIDRDFSATREERKSFMKDKEYLNKLFIERGFPVTHLNNFIECPWKYFFIDLLRLPAPQANAALYGSAMHYALADYFNAYKIEEDMEIEKTCELFENYLNRTSRILSMLSLFQKPKKKV